MNFSANFYGLYSNNGTLKKIINNYDQVQSKKIEQLDRITINDESRIFEKFFSSCLISLNERKMSRWRERDEKWGKNK